jgi:hypothetical protein
MDSGIRHISDAGADRECNALELWRESFNGLRKRFGIAKNNRGIVRRDGLFCHALYLIGNAIELSNILLPKFWTRFPEFREFSKINRRFRNSRPAGALPRATTNIGPA